MPTQPRPDQLEALAERAPEGKLYMLNLLRFKELAEYPDGRDPGLTGREAYARYGALVSEIVASLGGRIVFAGPTNTLVIGDGDAPEWDQVAVVEYPSLDAFRSMTQSEAYQEAHVHREAGLAHQLLINCLDVGQALARLAG